MAVYARAIETVYHLVKSWQFILVQLEVWYMMRSSHYSEIQESLVALCEVKGDPHVEKSVGKGLQRLPVRLLT